MTNGSDDENGCMTVAWDLCWGGSRRTKPCVFPCKVAAAGNEIPRVCGGCGLGSAKSWSSPQCNGCFDVFRVSLHIAVTWCFGSCGCETHCHCNGCMSVACCFFGEEGTKLSVFRCKVAAAGNEKSILCKLCSTK